MLFWDLLSEIFNVQPWFLFPVILSFMWVCLYCFVSLYWFAMTPTEPYLGGAIILQPWRFTCHCLPFLLCLQLEQVAFGKTKLNSLGGAIKLQPWLLFACGKFYGAMMINIFIRKFEKTIVARQTLIVCSHWYVSFSNSNNYFDESEPYRDICNF